MELLNVLCAIPGLVLTDPTGAGELGRRKITARWGMPTLA